MKSYFEICQVKIKIFNMQSAIGIIYLIIDKDYKQYSYNNIIAVTKIKKKITQCQR